MPQTRPSDTLGPLLEPRSVAILGASNDPTRIGGRPLRYMLEAGFDRPLYPVNPNRAEVQGIAAYPSVAEIPEAADCAIIALPAGLVAGALRDCAARGVRAAVIFSSGFAESDAEGTERQAELTQISHDHGIRIVGPNCLGLFNSAVHFYATFTSSLDGERPRAGAIAIVSQSGAYGSHVFALARAKGLGVRYWITTGNECDVEVAEAIAWVARREEIKVIVAYAEGVRDGPRLKESLALARSLGKPVIFMKVGRSEIGAQAAASHTASLAGSDAVYDALFRQYGAHRVRNTEEMLDLAYACSGGIFPRGRRIGLVTISGGVGVQMADDAVDLGLDVAPMPASAQAALKEILPYAATRNPVDITAQAFNDLSLVAKNFRLMLDQGGYDMILAFFTMVAASPYIVEDLLAALEDLRRDYPDRLIMLSLIAPPETVARYEAAGYLVFEDPSRAIAAAAALADFARPVGSSPEPGPLPTVTVPQRHLSESESKDLLRAAGLPLVEDRRAESAVGAADAARDLGFPLVMKINSPAIAHKSEIGGVLLGIDSPEAAAAGFTTLMARAEAAAPGADHRGVLLSPQVTGGVETILGLQNDPVFGPSVMLGLGGIFAEVMGDVVLRLAPLDRAGAMEMIRELKGYPLLAGARGRPPADLAALAESLVRLSDVALAAGDQVASVDINPFTVLPEGRGALGLDALVVPKAPETP